MKTIKKLQLAAAITASMTLVGCGSDSDDAASLTKVFDCTPVDTAGSRTICIGSADDLSDTKVQTDLLTAVVAPQTGDTIVMPQGRYNIDTEITFNGIAGTTGLTFIGAGMDKTILDFSTSTEDGFHITNTEDVTLEKFGVYESANNAIKLVDVDGIIIREVATVWETDYQASNGAYGIYPVLTENVLIEDCYVKGSADAGVYVGQSKDIIVRGCTAEKNVAGIEIENSINADVYNNTATGNTGGILVFDLPIAQNTRYSKNIRVFNNTVTSNNAPNFASSGSNPAGVHIVPPGTGIILLATEDVEVFNNTITDNESMAIAISSFLLPDDDVATYGDRYGAILMSGWLPLTRTINIHDNTISQATYNPQGDLIKDVIIGYATSTQAPIPDVFSDGIGELLANAGALMPLAEGLGLALAQATEGAYNGDPLPGYSPYVYTNADGNPSDAICVSNNGDATMGTVSRTTVTADAFDADSNPVFHLTADTPDVFACGGDTGRDVPPAPAKSVVTVGDQSFSCGVDDAATAPDVCAI